NLDMCFENHRRLRGILNGRGKRKSTLNIQILCALLVVSCVTARLDASPQPSFNQAESVEQRLSAKYSGKSWMLAAPYCGQVLQFDAGGAFKAGGVHGSWTTFC